MHHSLIIASSRERMLGSGGPEVVDAVAERYESTEGTLRHLADRAIEALRVRAQCPS